MTVEWHGTRIFKEVEDAVLGNEKSSAERIFRDAKRNCPVGEWERSVSGGPKHGGKSWTARKPGTLKKSIELHKSKFKDGGYIVGAGNFDVFYASFVELGIPAHGIPKKSFLRGALKKEKGRFWRNLNRDIG